jgi:DNA-directed RNA polymerase subunit RPC12/RpoP
MGLRSLRAICPNCGAKIHTQPKGLGHITWANSWITAQTGRECPYCGVALTGKVTAAGRAELADGPKTTIGGFVKTRRW